jgi:hypothetical protein
MNMTPDEQYTLQHKLHDCEDLRKACGEITENVKALSESMREIVGRATCKARSY